MTDFLMQDLFWKVLTAFGGISAFCWSVYQYLDQRKRELRRLRFEQFQQVLTWVAGRTVDGTVLTEIHQIAAIWQLTEFPEYRDIALPVLRRMWPVEEQVESNHSSFVDDAVMQVIEKLS